MENKLGALMFYGSVLLVNLVILFTRWNRTDNYLDRLVRNLLAWWTGAGIVVLLAYMLT